MDTFKEWLYRNRRLVPVEDLLMITSELDKRTVALKGSGVFPVTYPLVASVAGNNFAISIFS